MVKGTFTTIKILFILLLLFTSLSVLLYTTALESFPSQTYIRGQYNYISENNQLYQNNKQKSPEPPSKISQVYYINLDTRKDRNNFMKKMVLPMFDDKQIPYKRISGRRGIGITNETCVSGKTPPKRCSALVGVIRSNLHILNHERITNYTLILEDDWLISSLRDLDRAINSVPKDWDLIRFDCNGKIPQSFGPIDENNVFRVMHVTNATYYFCGGGYAMLIRPRSIEKLKKIWSTKPYQDLDCALTDFGNTIKSYCVNQKIMKSANLGSDIGNWNFVK